ncbi:MAG: hypothetical protein WHT06_04875 [Desulfobacterales bacterium]
MLFEYGSLLGMTGAGFSWELLRDIALAVLAGVALVLLGFRLKGVWGAVFALAAGVGILLYREGMIRF